jgi:hypothetical protein
MIFIGRQAGRQAGRQGLFLKNFFLICEFD